MLFRLMVLLAGLIFLVMYMASHSPAPRPVRQALPAASGQSAPEVRVVKPATIPPPQPAPERILPPPVTLRPKTAATALVPEPVPAPPADVPDLEALPQDTATADPAAPVPGADPAETPIALPGFGATGFAVEGSLDAMSLSDRVRARIESGVPVDLTPVDLAPVADPVPPDLAPADPALVTDSAPAAAADGPSAPDTPAPDATAPVVSQMAEVTASAVNLRAGPSTGEAVVGRLSSGDRVEYLGEPVAGWAEIRLPGGGAPAYMASKFLRMREN